MTKTQFRELSKHWVYLMIIFHLYLNSFVNLLTKFALCQTVFDCNNNKHFIKFSETFCFMQIDNSNFEHTVSCCWSGNYFLKFWKIANVTPLPKIKYPRNFKGLRPISFLSALSKILGKAMEFQLREHFVNI